jgi:hypothetical protein
MLCRNASEGATRATCLLHQRAAFCTVLALLAANTDGASPGQAGALSDACSAVDRQLSAAGFRPTAVLATAALLQQAVAIQLPATFLADAVSTCVTGAADACGKDAGENVERSLWLERLLLHVQSSSLPERGALFSICRCVCVLFPPLHCTLC